MSTSDPTHTHTQRRVGGKASRLGCGPSQVGVIFAGTKVAKILAEDADAPSSPNSHVVDQLLSPEPEEPAELRAFELDSTSGSVTLGAAQLQAGQNILLQVLAMDLGGTDGGKCPSGDRGSLTPRLPPWPPRHALLCLRPQQHL